MARLNEIPQSTDSYDTLRRKLLRQNRELARVNSSQSLRIRHLENECARMLSENLELRGQILTLEKEVENSKAQRIADHALEIKTKLEAQLVEWGSLLAGLGLEPPVKRHDAVGRRMSHSQSRGSMGRRSPRKSLRDLAREAEARAREEGRLTPIMEHKSYPRRTMDSEEIMALRNEAEAADTSGSSDIGPPPTSRFADPDSPRKDPESPSKPPQPSQSEGPAESVPESPVQAPTPKSTEPMKEEKADDSPAKTLSTVPQAETTTSENKPLEQPSKSGAKRKLAARDESENAAPATVVNTTTSTRRKATILREKSGNKTLKEITAMRREERGKQPPAQSPALRKPLSAKSTNDDLTSPKKNATKAAASEKPEKLENPEKPIRTVKIKQLNKQPRETTKRKVAAVLDEQAPPPPPPAETSTKPPPGPEPEKQPDVPPATTPSAGLDNLSPTPEPKSQPQSRDTPPPADISSQGETSRPSRRSRTQVSYAEPNLRDKMRRPSKQLVDAVTGETKYRRSESLAAEEIAAMGEKVKSEQGGTDFSQMPRASPKAAEAKGTEAEGPASPLAQKGLGERLPSSVVTERRKRRSSILAKDFAAENTAEDVPEDDSLDTSLTSMNTSETSGDIYDFPAGSPEDPTETTKKGTRRASRAGQDEDGEEWRPSRKRASIHVPRRSRVDPAGENDGGVAEGVKDRSMRRRSTML